MTTPTSAAATAFADLPGLMSLMTGDAKHDQAATSTLDVLWVLYDRVLRVTPETMTDDTRDRFLLSKGHGSMAYYAVLAAKGFLDPAGFPGRLSSGLSQRRARPAAQALHVVSRGARGLRGIGHDAQVAG